MAAQTADALSQIEALLAAKGVTKASLLNAVLFVTDLALRPDANQVWQA